MTYEWNDNDGVKHVTAWSQAVRNAMIRGGAEFQSLPVLHRHWIAQNPAATTWAAEFLLRDGESREFLGLWINSSVDCTKIG